MTMSKTELKKNLEHRFCLETKKSDNGKLTKKSTLACMFNKRAAIPIFLRLRLSDEIQERNGTMQFMKVDLNKEGYMKIG